MITLRQEKPLRVTEARGGFVVLDKPAGPSSHEVTAWIQKIYNDKAGHLGTLDPFVTGVLVVAVGKAVKLLDAMSKSDKEYVGIARFEKPVEREALEALFREFTGEIYQTPPLESAVKKQLRTRRIHSLGLLELDGRDALFRASCQHGTYIRTLVKDIGELLGNSGRLVELRRTRSGSFTEDESVYLQDIVDAPDPWGVLLPLESLPAKRIVVGNKAVDALCHGAKLARPGVVALDEGIGKGELVLLVTAAGQAIGLAQADMATDEIIAAEKGIVATPTSIVMERGLFPGWK